MEHIAPLLQTLLWVGLFSAVFWRYHEIIGKLLETIHKRIESGSAVKAGPLELAEQLRPQNAEQQREKLAVEVEQLTQEEPPEPYGQAANARALPPPDPSMLRSLYFQSEDLGLRAVQAHYGAPVSRQVQVGPDLQLDGFFTLGGVGYLVEVKYARFRYPQKLLQATAEKLLTKTSSLGWRNIHIVLVVVYGEATRDLKAEESRMREIFGTYEEKVTVHCYRLKELAERFGVNING